MGKGFWKNYSRKEKMSNDIFIKNIDKCFFGVMIAVS